MEVSIQIIILKRELLNLVFLLKRLILGVLDEYIQEGLSVTFIPPVTNKFTRARPMALDFKNNNIVF